MSDNEQLDPKKSCHRCALGELCQIYRGLLFFVLQPVGDDKIVFQTVANHCTKFDLALVYKVRDGTYYPST